MRHLAISTWTTEQGLPQEFITAIRQTPDGFLWVGTYGGLARFDGVHFRVFVQDAQPLRSKINSLEVDTKGRLWVGTWNGLFYYHDHIFQPVLSHGHPLKAVLQLSARHSGGVWVRTANEVLAGDEGVVAPYDLPVSPAEILDLKEDSTGLLWLATHKVVVSLLGTEAGPQRVTTYPFPGTRSLCTTRDGQVFISDGTDAYLLKEGQFQALYRKQDQAIFEMIADRNGSLWMVSGGSSGVSRWTNGSLERIDVNGGLVSDDVRSIFEDRDGDIWLGSVAGLQRLRRGIFQTYSEQDGLKKGRQEYDSIFQDKSGTVWVGSSVGVSAFKDGRWTLVGIPQGLGRGQVMGFAEGAIRPMISIGESGLYGWRNDGGAGRYEKLVDRPGEFLFTPHRSQDGSLWFSIPRKGVFRLKDQVLTQFGREQGLTDDTVNSLTEDKSGQLWAGGATGLFVLNGERWLKIMSTLPIFSITTASGGGLYLSTLSGLIYRNGAMSWTLAQQQGLPSDSVYISAEDAYGSLWIATADGICRIPKAQLDAFRQGSAQRVTPEVFTLADGLKSRGVVPLGQVTQLRAQDDSIWFATTSAPSRAEPSSTEAAPPVSMLDEIQVDEEHHPPTALKIAPGRHRVAFLFTAPSFVAPEQIQFRYRLQGWDVSWVNAGTTREAVYASLPPGSYKFEVQALGRTGIPGPISAATSLVLRPFFWQTHLFFAAMLALLLLLVIEITRRQTSLHAERLNARFQERASERERIALQIHDTFVQDLVGTALQLELLTIKLEDDPVGARTLLLQLTGRLRGIVGRSRDMISNLHSMAAPDQDLVELLYPLEAEFRLEELPEYRVEAEGEALSMTPYIRDQILGICREAVANAFRHAQATSIVLSLRQEGSKVSLSIRDNGRGISEVVLRQGRQGHFGLRGMRSHALLIGAELDIATAINVGTTISFVVDLKRVGLGGWRDRLQNFLRLRRHTPVMNDTQSTGDEF